MDITIPAFISAMRGLIVFFLGAFLTRRVAFLRDDNIPEPVSGGIAGAQLTWAWFASTGARFSFEMEVRGYLLVLFFAIIGLNARIADVLRGGKLLLILLALTVGFVLLQNVVGLRSSWTTPSGVPSRRHRVTIATSRAITSRTSIVRSNQGRHR